MRYSEEKATAVAVYFLEQAGGTLEDLKLMKLMYLAEREAIRLRNAGITGDQFFSMKNGPILSQTLDRMSPREQIDPANVWREHINLPSQWLVGLAKPFNIGQELSKRELKIIADVWAQYGHLSKWELVEITHQFSEWRNPGTSAQSIAFQDILSGLGFNQEETKSRLAEYRVMNRQST